VPALPELPFLADAPWYLAVLLDVVLAVVAMFWFLERRSRRSAESALRESLAAEARHADALATAQREARDAQRLEAVGRLTSGVAHDFNNLLTAILGYAQLAQMKLGADHPQASHLQQIVNAAERAEKLTRQLLNFSRQESAGPQAFDLNLVVKETGYLLRRLIGEDVTLRMKLAPDGAMIRADSGDISQLIVHLTMNARDAMPKGGELWIATEAVGENVTLTIRGSGGVGQVAATLRRGVPSGGLLEIEREGTADAAFLVSWPLAIEETPAPTVSSALPVTPPTEPEHRTALLVEDDDILRPLMAEMLESQGFEVLAASDGENALEREKVHAGPIALVVTDLVMPRLGGSELVASLLERRKDLAVLYVSAHHDDDIAQAAVAAADHCSILHKPFAPGAFAQAVRDALKRAVAED
jgi:two-component system, cell cycle sensor histidine kinase and response regulator CckA